MVIIARKVLTELCLHWEEAASGAMERAKHDCLAVQPFEMEAGS